MLNPTFRASSMGKLMTEPRSKSETLSETAKTYIEEIWDEKEHGYIQPIPPTLEMLKGIMCESDSIDLVQDVLGGSFRTKNLETHQVGQIAGTPDIILSDCIEDIKTSWDFRTFRKADGNNKMYFWQGMAYMHLLDVPKFRLIYCLIPTPKELLEKEIERLWFAYGKQNSHGYTSHVRHIESNNERITKLPKEKRIKVFTFDFSTEAEANMLGKVEKANEYYKTLSL